jgi:hypothetical protein
MKSLVSNKDKNTVRLPISLGIGISVAVDENEGKSYMILTPFQYISFITSMFTGLFMLAVRLIEPYFWFVFKKAILYCYGTPYTEEQLKEKESKLMDTTTAFLKSSLNIDLVHIILKCISQECTKKEYDNLEDELKDEDFTETYPFYINEVEIENAEEWHIFNEVQNNEYQDLNEMPNTDQNLIINESIKVTELAPKVF